MGSYRADNADSKSERKTESAQTINFSEGLGTQPRSSSYDAKNSLKGPTVIYVQGELPANVPGSLMESVVLDSIARAIEEAPIVFENDRDQTSSSAKVIYKRKQVKTMEQAMKNPKYKSQLVKEEHLHGFMQPHSRHQKASWVVFAFNLVLECLIVGYYNAVIPITGREEVNGTLGTLFVLLDLLVLLLAVLATITDPSDPVVKWERYCKLSNQPFPDEEYDLFCQWCDCHVMDKTKHCGRCNRCTKDFDHHCNWLNNCVGSKNYKYFFVLTGLVLVQAITHVSAGAYAV